MTDITVAEASAQLKEFAKTIKLGYPVTGETRLTLIRFLAIGHKAGISIRALAAMSNRGYGGARALLIEGGVTMRPRGGNNRPVMKSRTKGKGKV